MRRIRIKGMSPTTIPINLLAERVHARAVAEGELAADLMPTQEELRLAATRILRRRGLR